ncbi:hypothetical protein JCM8208_005941 [Rhodotorula glutinis]
MAAKPPSGGAPSATRHCQPVQSALSPPVVHPARETTTQARPLTSAQVGPPPVPPEVAAEKQRKKRQAQRDAKVLVPVGDEGTRGRIVVPGGSSSSTIAATTPATVTKSARQKKGRKKKKGGLPSQASQFNKSKAGPSSSSNSSSLLPKSTSPASTSPSFAPVQGQGNAVAFTRPRGDALN